jgi:RNA polymerase sigma-70 factor, ECF subfamily
MQPSEKQLVASAVGGDEDALTELLRQFGPNIRAQIQATLSEKWRSVLDADDIMQVTYLEAFLRIDRFEPRGEGSFAGWLSQIAKNNMRDAIDELSRMKRPNPENRVIGSSDESAVALFEQLGCTTTTPSRNAGRREVAQAVESAIGGLPDDYANVIRMYDIEGKSIGDVAAAMDRSEGAVYMLRARAHDRLREALGSSTRW